MRLSRKWQQAHEKGQPVLVGTITIETSELSEQDAEQDAAFRIRY